MTGFVNMKGERVIPCRWEAVGTPIFSEAYCAAYDDGKHADYINCSGNLAIPRHL